MKLSKNFTLEEMVATSHKGLQDTPTLEVVQNLQKLCVLVLQPLRDAIGRPVYINSGYRSKRLNARVGGVPNSRHLQGPPTPPVREGGASGFTYKCEQRSCG